MLVSSSNRLLFDFASVLANANSTNLTFRYWMFTAVKFCDKLFCMNRNARACASRITNAIGRLCASVRPQYGRRPEIFSNFCKWHSWTILVGLNILRRGKLEVAGWGSFDFWDAPLNTFRSWPLFKRLERGGARCLRMVAVHLQLDQLHAFVHRHWFSSRVL